MCVCEAHEQSRATHRAISFREQSCLWHLIFGVILPSVVRKEKREQYIYILFALFTLYFVVHLTVTYTSRLSSLVL